MTNNLRPCLRRFWIGFLSLSFIAYKNPVLRSPERYRAELGFADQRLHFPKQILAFGSHLFVINGDVEKTDSLGR